MKWLANFSLIMRSNLTALCERCEDPERMLHQLLIDMESELGRVRESVAGAIADEIQLGRKVQQADEEAETWNDGHSSFQSRHHLRIDFGIFTVGVAVTPAVGNEFTR